MTVLRDIADIVHQAAQMASAMVEYKVSDKVRQLDSGVTKAAMGIGFLKIFVLLLAAGLGLVLWGLYRLLADTMSRPAAAMTLGAVILAVGLLVCWIVGRGKRQT